eukprot:Em0009g851a
MPKGTASIQTIVEEPHLYLIALNSSSIEDQAAIIPDRVSCLPDLNEPLVTESGIAVHDVLRFFTGDHPAQQFERGTQVGGVYKSEGCGCKSTMMADQANSLHCKTRSLGDIQTLAVQGVLGKVPGALKPLYIPDLPVNDVRKEAVARGIAVTGKNRATLQKELQEILQGVQRVPSLLLLQPDESLTNLNLQYYEVMDCLSGDPTLVFVCKDPHQNVIALCECDDGLNYGLGGDPTLVFVCNDPHQNVIALCECDNGPTDGLSGDPTLVFVCNDPHQNVIALCECDNGPTYGLGGDPTLVFVCNDPHQNVIALCECDNGPTDGLSGDPTLVFVCNDPHQNVIALCECDNGPTYGLGGDPTLVFVCNDPHQNVIALCECDNGPTDGLGGGPAHLPAMTFMVIGQVGHMRGIGTWI